MDTSMSQSSGNNCQNNQANRDINITYGNPDQQEKKDFGIIEKIFKFLFSEDITEQDVTESSNGKGLKKIPLNFSGDSLQTINEMVKRTTKKRDLVRKFVNSQRELDESKIDALILKLQKDFRSLKNTENNYKKIEEVKIIEQMANKCIDKSKKDNPDYSMNALAIILYFFEMCDFGKSEEAKMIQEVIF